MQPLAYCSHCRRRLTFVALLLVFLLHARVPTGYADSPCRDYEVAVQSFAAALPRPVAGGRFEVSPRRQDGTVRSWSIRYAARGKTLLQKTIPVPRFADLEVLSPRFPGPRTIVFDYTPRATAGFGCSYLVFPDARTFSVLKIPGWRSSVQDLDADAEDEIVASEYQQWNYDCAPYQAARIYWPRIYHFDARRGTFVDVSRRFPRFYTFEAQRYQSEYKPLRAILSSACRAGLDEFISRLAAMGAAAPTPRR